MNYDDEPYEYEPEEFTLFPTEGKYIINAFTGKPTKYLVGSKFEALFWKVLNSSLSSYNPTPKKKWAPREEVLHISFLHLRIMSGSMKRH